MVSGLTLTYQTLQLQIQASFIYLFILSEEAYIKHGVCCESNYYKKVKDLFVQYLQWSKLNNNKNKLIKVS